MKAGIWMLGHARRAATFALPPCAHSAVTQAVITPYLFGRTLASFGTEVTIKVVFSNF